MLPAPPFRPWNPVPSLYGNPGWRFALRPLPTTPPVAPAVLPAGPMYEPRAPLLSPPTYAVPANPFPAGLGRGLPRGGLVPAPRRPLLVSIPRAAAGGMHPGVYRFRPVNRRVAVSQQVFRYDGRDWRFRPVARPAAASRQPAVIRPMPPVQGLGPVESPVYFAPSAPATAGRWPMRGGINGTPMMPVALVKQPGGYKVVPAGKWLVAGPDDRRGILTVQPRVHHPLRLARAG